ncbi:MAG: endonuclease/exonuclease/phosphatase family protein [Actinomycetota bacterium]|nr:endonuclease/exonuclease/phosphatase family protein [Actinomycetota bacterium]
MGVVAEQYQEEAVEPPKRRRRRWVTAVLLLLVLALTGLTVLRLGGFDGNRFTVAALALTPYIAGFALLVCLLALLLGRRMLSLLALVQAITLGVLLVPRSLADGEPMPDGQRVRVMTANLLLGKADATTLVNLVRDARVDVLALQELTPASVDALDQAGLGELLPYRVLREQAGGSGAGLMAKVPLRQIVLIDEPMSFQHPAVVVDLSGAVDLEIMAVHAMPPVGSERNRITWNRELAALPGSDTSHRPRVLAGDFNATLDHRALNAVLDRGYFDGAELAGEALRPTWSQYPFGPPMTIDHVLVDRRIGVPTSAVYDLPGSDHNALLTELILPE